MGRIGRRFARVRFTSRLTWSFSVRAGLGRERPARTLLPAPVSAAGRRVSVAVLRTALEAARPRPLAPPTQGARRRRPRPPRPLRRR
ncbi:hypothetical protein [Streptomyces phaeofaciens]|uniref:hypothetical protein n=1 Tax=Streptomyces phaeofaciens TaxID=68254 RepID=UPI0016793CC3|nr:hypothetical protein [Streptomyces phaeofaciens]